MPLLKKFQLKFQLMWAVYNPPGLAQHLTPIIVQLKQGAAPVWVKQYPMLSEAQRSIRTHITLGRWKFWSPVNFPGTLHSPKANDFRSIQDLREVNKRVEDIYPIVTNSYILLSLLAPAKQVDMVLDLKDAFIQYPFGQAELAPVYLQMNQPGYWIPWPVDLELTTTRI